MKRHNEAHDERKSLLLTKHDRTAQETEGGRRTLAVFDPWTTGHHIQYLRLIFQAATRRGYRVLWGLFDDSAWRPHVQELSAKYEPSVTLIPIRTPRFWSTRPPKSTSGLIFRDIQFRSSIRRFVAYLSKTGLPDYILLPDLDHCLYSFALLGSDFMQLRWGGIVMRPSFHYRAMGIAGPENTLSNYVKVHVFDRYVSAGNFSHLFTIDEPLYRYIQERFYQQRERTTLLYDPVRPFATIPSKKAKLSLGIHEDQRVLLVYGVLSKRKGIEPLLEALHQNALPRDIIIVLAGEEDVEVTPLLESRAIRSLIADGRIRTYKGYLDDTQESLVFSAADAVWLGYIGHYGMSGVLLQAGAASLPIVACRDGMIGWLTEKYCLGIILEDFSAQKIGAAIKRVMSTEGCGLGANGLRLAKRHTVDAFVAPLFDAIDDECTTRS